MKVKVKANLINPYYGSYIGKIGESRMTVRLPDRTIHLVRFEKDGKNRQFFEDELEEVCA